ncbi:MAG: hypothetical protein CMA86_04445 [Euryarchaeota archaeon]|nr:hypothetical protein [Euryarchaeota archaeon]
MVLTRTVSPLVRPSNKVSHLALDNEGVLLAWNEGRHEVFIGRIESNQVRMEASVQHPHSITSLHFHRDSLIVGDELEGFTVYSTAGVLKQTVEVDGGVQSIASLGSRLAFLSGMGEVHLIDIEGEMSVNLSELHGCHDVVHFAVHSQKLAVATQDGRVFVMDDDKGPWSRPPRGTMGERITGLGFTQQGSFFLSREGHALVAGEEEAIEFELWRDGELIVRLEQRMRLLTSNPAAQGAVLGFDDGSVYSLDEQGELTLVMETKHPVFACLQVNDSIVASSWFYVHGKTKDMLWKVEHQGMPTCLAGNETSGSVIFAGDDQNDYTAPEPIGFVDLNESTYECDEAELSLWFSVESTPPSLSAEELYADTDDLLMHLTQDEQDAYTNTPSADSSDVLLEAMGDVADDVHDATSAFDEDSMTEELNKIEHLSVEETSDLMDALSATVDHVFKPQAVAGEAQDHLADADGTCVVLLDGRGTEDPHNHISSWSWHNERGEEVAAAPQVKVRLPIGKHVFELRVVDRDGSWTTDRVEILVRDGSTS